VHGFRVVYEDADLLVADKPAGLLTIATATEKRRTLYAQLYERLHRRRPAERVFIVHRLDRDVSGLIVFAKTPAAQEALQAQFRARSAGRTYLARVEGTVREDEFSVRTLLAESAVHRVYVTEDSRRGKAAVTHVRVRARRAGTTSVEIRLETGRKHQIRAHLAHVGHPIVGDRRYGADPTGPTRLALHAVRLRFRHPRTGAWLEFESPAPWDRRRGPDR